MEPPKDEMVVWVQGRLYLKDPDPGQLYGARLCPACFTERGVFEFVHLSGDDPGWRDIECGACGRRFP